MPRTAGYTGFTPRDPKYSSAVVDKPKGVDAAASSYDHDTGFIEGLWETVRAQKAEGAASPARGADAQ